ncbi:MAG: hypothetical protein K5921_04900 [Lachnospiraceae bacterium]|nr:hypothetical protein [Lachnospiraceae bacterium]
MIRLLAGDDSLVLAGVIQCILAVYASYRYITYVLNSIVLKVSDKDESIFQSVLYRGALTVAITGTVVAPYIITSLISVTHVMLANGILSEALALPLFLLYVVNLHKMMIERTEQGMVNIKYALVSFLLAFVLALTRSQMIVTLIAWVIIAVTSEFNSAKRGMLWVMILAFIISIPLRTVLTKSYNYVFNGRYVDNVYTKLTMLSNIFFVTDRESGELIEDEDTKNIFYRLYDIMDDNEWSYKYCGGNAGERAIYLEDMHDKVKFDVLEAGFRDIMNERGMPDYIDYNLKAEEYSGRLIGILWPECFSRWFVDWIIMGCRGIVRSIAVCNKILYLYVAAALVYMLSGGIKCLKNEKETAFFALIALLLLFGNAFGTAFTIMCLSRYMIYAFPLFYSAVIAITIKLLSRYKSGKTV